MVLKGLLADPTAKVHVICCYLPWAGSTQLQDLDLTTRHMALQQQLINATTSQPNNIVVVAGDFNAKIGEQQALSNTAITAILQHNNSSTATSTISLARQQQENCKTADQPGYQLNDLCIATDTINLTGLTTDDSPAKPSYVSSANSSTARIDHFLVSPSTLPYITHHQVLDTLLGSDHHPIQLCLSLQPTTAPATDPEPHYRFQQIIPSDDPAVIRQYQEIIADAATWANFQQLASETNTSSDDLLAAFNTVIFRAAQAAGYRIRWVGPPKPQHHNPPSKYKVWHDTLCKHLQQQIRALLQEHDTSKAAELRQLQQQYRKRIRTLLRRHRAEHAKEQLQKWKLNRNQFWRSYRPHSSPCPFSPSTIARHFNTKMNSYQPAPAPATPAEQLPAQQAIDITSECPTVADIAAAIKHSSSTSAGIDGIPTALLHPVPIPQPADDLANAALGSTTSNADALLSTAAGLHAVFQRISSTGAIPQQWRSAVLVPIYKNKGDRSDISNYRPLSMPTVTCRLWSSIINGRLMHATSELLPDVMFGFRPNRSCSDPLFIIRHMADMRRAKLGKLFAVAFMDLSGAYDSVDRTLLFRKLRQQVGLAEHTVSLLESLYDGTECIVKAELGTSQPFAVTCGLRQGCPLSTTLFNLFIFDLHNRLTEICHGCGVRTRRIPATYGPNRPAVGAQPIRVSDDAPHLLLTDFGYADDIALCANTAVQLQQLIDCFAAYCREHGLIINPSKCEVMVVSGNSRAMQGASWHDGGLWGDRKPLARVQKFKYLGVELHGTKTIKAALDHRLSRMIAAQSTVYRRLRELHIQKDPLIVADMFDIVGGAAGSYGCEIWSTHYLGEWHLTDCKLQRYQASVYKRSMGAKSSTSNMLACFEAGKYPLQIQWLARTVRYWNKLVGLHTERGTLYEVFCANVHYGLVHDAACWAKELHAGLAFVDSGYDWKTHMLQLRKLDCKHLVNCAKAKFRSCLQHYNQPSAEAENCPSRRRCCYKQWMYPQGDLDELPRPAYLSGNLSLKAKRVMARFRLNGAPVRANLEHNISYSDRVCRFGCQPASSSGAQVQRVPVENDKHLVLECVATSQIRARPRYCTMFRPGVDMHQLMGLAYDPAATSTLVHCISEMISKVEGLSGAPIRRISREPNGSRIAG